MYVNFAKKIAAGLMCCSLLFNMCACEKEERQSISQDTPSQKLEATQKTETSKENPTTTEEQNKTEAQVQKPETMTGPELTDVKYMEIKTPYAVLSYPEEWKEQLEVEISEDENCVVSFYAILEDSSKHQLFVLTFGTDLDNKLGQIQQTDGSRIDVAVDFNEVDGKNDTLLSMQEAANELLGKLPLIKEVAAIEETDSVEDIVIETPYGNLLYPGIWSEYLLVKQNDGDVYCVSFEADMNGKNQELFVIEFGLELDAEIGTVTTVDGTVISVGVQMAEINDQWTDDEQVILYAMQEAINDVIESIELN